MAISERWCRLVQLFYLWILRFRWNHRTVCLPGSSEIFLRMMFFLVKLLFVFGMFRNLNHLRGLIFKPFGIVFFVVMKISNSRSSENTLPFGRVIDRWLLVFKILTSLFIPLSDFIFFFLTLSSHLCVMAVIIEFSVVRNIINVQ
jgi:hypothetical protein